MHSQGSVEAARSSDVDDGCPPAAFRNVLLAQLGRMPDFLNGQAAYRSWLEG